MSVFGKNGFGMKLHAFNGMLTMPHPHDFIQFTLFVLGPGGDLQTGRQRGFLNHQRMIAGSFKWIINTFKKPAILMMYQGGFAMHDRAGMHDASTKGLANTLMAQTYAKNGFFAGKMLDRLNRYSGFVRRTGTGDLWRRY